MDGVTINKITSNNFEKLDVSTLFYGEGVDDSFAVIVEKNEVKFKFSWRGEKIEPTILCVSEYKYAIGVNLNFSIVNIRSEEILLNIELSFFFFESRIYNNYIYIITELEILKLENASFKLVDSFILPDIFEDLLFEEKRLCVKCVDGDIYEFAN